MMALHALTDGGSLAVLTGDASPEAGARRILDYLVEVGLPLIILVGAALLLPNALARRLPKNMGGLAANLILCALLLTLLSAGVLWLAARLYGATPDYGLISVMTLVWGPIVVVILMQHPQRWRPDL